MNAPIPLPLLERAQVAAPCPARWDDMPGDDKIRHCALCNLNVHNFSAMSRDEAETLLARHFNPDGSPIESAGRLCGGFYRRADGTYLLQDCPRGLAALRARVRWAWLRIAAAIGLAGLAAAKAASEMGRAEHNRRMYDDMASRVDGGIGMRLPPQPVPLKNQEPFRAAWELVDPAPQTVSPLLGKIAPRPSPASPAPQPAP